MADACALVDWSYAAARRECEARVVRWEWASFARHSLEPGYFEIGRYRRGDLLDEEPGAMHRAWGHGFDADGLLAVERRHVEFPGQYYETFYALRPGGIARKHFSYSKDKPLINSAFFELDGSRVTRLDTVYAGGRQMSQLYTYDAEGRLVRDERTGPTDDASIKYDVEWIGDAISLVRFRTAAGRTGIQYERIDRDGLAQRRGEIVSTVTRAILAAVAAEVADAPVYAIALWSCDAEYQHRFPPNVAFATETQRGRFIAAHGEKAREYLWSPPEWGRDTMLDLEPAFLRTCELANAAVWQHDLHGEADVVVAAIAAAVGASAYPFAVTEDVVVFAVQVDRREPPDQQLARQLPAEHLTAFKQRGWL